MPDADKLRYLTERETRSREQAADALDMCARMAHLAIANNYAARIAAIRPVEPIA